MLQPTTTVKQPENIQVRRSFGALGGEIRVSKDETSGVLKYGKYGRAGEGVGVK